MTPSMKLHLNGFISCLLGYSKATFAAIHLYSVLSQTGEYWDDYRGGHTSGELRREGSIQDLQTKAVGPDGRIYLLLI